MTNYVTLEVPDRWGNYNVGEIRQVNYWRVIRSRGRLKFLDLQAVGCRPPSLGEAGFIFGIYAWRTTAVEPDDPDLLVALLADG